jgi:hypothetical protein
MNTLDDMQRRAQGFLDGMSTNKERMAKDVLQLVKLVRAMQDRRQEQAGAEPMPDDTQRQGAFGDAFDGIWDDIFKGKRT